MKHICVTIKLNFFLAFFLSVPNMPVLLSDRTAMVEWLRCCTRIHKVLCSNLSIAIHRRTLGKSLTAQLSRMTHSYRTEYIISQYVGQKGVQTPPSVKKIDDRNWLHVDPNDNRTRPQRAISLWEVIIIIII